ncbi:hypothetical protein M8N42_02615 [Enterobacter asburiae]|uniref:hypothetical protein n=1 Tax=Enterobacter asburiae TaxID=61645 RepID=UPI00207567D0|nr:hypothetical protein [Enterobacter asburiae]MCM6996514.1 hypothetical protein [Enterobacter asburiae]
MSNIDKQALNQEKIEWLNKLADMEYCKSNPGHWLMSLKDTNMLAKLALRSVALLDELEASEKLNAELMEKQRLIDICQGQGLEHRIAAEKRAEAAEKRISELEAREVKLPNPHAHLIWIQAGYAPDDYWDDVAVSHSEKDKCCDGSDRYPVYAVWEIKEALSAIGINVTAAGKGE